MADYFNNLGFSWPPDRMLCSRIFHSRNGAVFRKLLLYSKHVLDSLPGSHSTSIRRKRETPNRLLSVGAFCAFTCCTYVPFACIYMAHAIQSVGYDLTIAINLLLLMGITYKVFTRWPTPALVENNFTNVFVF